MKKEGFNKGEIIIYKSKEGPKLEVKLEEDTIWLTQNQIALLFNVKKAAISKHIKNIFSSKELDPNSTVSKKETVQIEGNRKIKRILTYFNLDMIISIGYRVNSARATQFRIWATKVLKEHLIKGYTINEQRLLQAQNRLKELHHAINFLKEKSKDKLIKGQEDEILNLLSDYSKTLTLLEQYDQKKIKITTKAKEKFRLSYETAKIIVNEVKKNLITKNEAGELFGKESGDKFKAILGNIYQTFGGKELYPSLEEKAAHLLYFIIKDHPFTDGNKRIGSFLFTYYLDKNDYLYRQTGEKKLNDNGLASLSLLIAISDPKDKEILINIITNLLKE
ncbi:MAG: virulence protein RhuM/Fic/DOC family protein [Elusimicrobiota bacterium]